MWERDSCASLIIKSVKTTISHDLINVIKMYLLDEPITIAWRELKTRNFRVTIWQITLNLFVIIHLQYKCIAIFSQKQF